MNPNIIDPLPAGGMTWGGKTRGPAINAGSGVGANFAPAYVRFTKA